MFRAKSCLTHWQTRACLRQGKWWVVGKKMNERTGGIIFYIYLVLCECELLKRKRELIQYHHCICEQWRVQGRPSHLRGAWSRMVPHFKHADREMPARIAGNWNWCGFRCIQLGPDRATEVILLTHKTVISTMTCEMHYHRISGVVNWWAMCWEASGQSGPCIWGPLVTCLRGIGHLRGPDHLRGLDHLRDPWPPEGPWSF